MELVGWIAAALAALIAWLKLVHDPRQRRLGGAEARLERIEEMADANDAELGRIEEIEARVDVDGPADVDAAIDAVEDWLGPGDHTPD